MDASAEIGVTSAEIGKSYDVSGWTIARLTPHGALPLEPGESEAPIEEAVAERFEELFTRGPGHGLLQLGLSEVGTLLPPALAFWRSFAMRFVAALCSRTEAIAVPPPPLEELTTLIEAAPPMLGGDYLDTNPVTPPSSRRHPPLFGIARRGQIALWAHRCNKALQNPSSETRT
jgi:hypothetical protein